MLVALSVLLPQTRGGISYPPGIPLPPDFRDSVDAFSDPTGDVEANDDSFPVLLARGREELNIEAPHCREATHQAGCKKELTLPVEDAVAWVPVQLELFASLECVGSLPAASPRAHNA